MEEKNLIFVPISHIGTYTTPFLIVDHELLGHSHSFNFRGSSVKLELPGCDLEKIINRKPWDETDDEAYLVSHSIAYPTIYHLGVSRVGVTLDLQQPLMVPSELPNKPPNAYDLLNNEQLDYMQQRASNAKEEADEAFNYWLDVIRWRTKNAAIGRRLRGNRTEYLSGLFRRADQKMLWATGTMLTTRTTKSITKGQWDAIQLSLRKGETPPIYLRFCLKAKFTLGKTTFRAQL